MNIRGALFKSVIVLILTGMFFSVNVIIINNTTLEPAVDQTADDILTPPLCEPNEYTTPNRDCDIYTRSSRPWINDILMNSVDLNNITFNQLYPSVTSDNDRTIYCAWQDIRSGDWDIYFSKSTNFGLDWSSNKLVTNISTSDLHQQYPDIALGSKTEQVVYIVWQDTRNDDGDIYFSYSIDNGATWERERQVNKFSNPPTLTRQWYPSITTDSSGGVYVVWADDSNGHWDIMLSTSTNKGLTWSDPILVNDPTPSYRNFNQSKPTIGVDGNGIIYVSWEDDRNGERQIYFSKSKDSGATFSTDIAVSSWKLNTQAGDHDLKVDNNGNIFVVWKEDMFSKYNVYFTKSLDQGINFNDPVQVNNVSNKCSPEANPVIEVDDKGNVFVAWSDQRAKNHIYMGFSLDNGATFKVNEVVDDADNTPATPLSTTTEEELERGQQQMTRLKNKNYLIWVDYRDDSNPDNQISENANLYLDYNTTPGNRIPERINFNEANTIKGWGYINLTWSASKDIDFSKYLIYKSTIKDYEPELLFLNATITNRNQNYVNITDLLASTTYYFYLTVEDHGGLSNTSKQYTVSTKPNIPPVIDLQEPDGVMDLVDSSFEIRWWDSDPDDNATIDLYYDNNLIPTDGRKFITTFKYGEDSQIDFYTWDISAILNGSYYICAIISDPVNGEQVPTYSKGKVTIFHGNLDPLIVLFKNPINSTEVQLTEPITVRFNKEIDETSVHQDSFYVLDTQDVKVDGEYQYNSSSNILKFYPKSRWNGSARYTVILKQSISDISGLFQLNQEHSWWFETEEYIVPSGTIWGEVVEAYNNQNKDTIGGVQITVTGKENRTIILTTTTDDSGKFIFTLTYGIYELSATKESYQDSKKLDLNVNSSSKDVTVELVRPVIIDFNINTRVTVDEELKVSAIAKHPRNEKINYFWDFGDGTIKPNQNITHKYKKTGTYTVTLTVQDENNGYVTQSEIVVVESAKEESNLLITIIIITIVILLIVLIGVILFARRVRQRRIEELEKRWEEEHEGRAELLEDEFEDLEAEEEVEEEETETELAEEETDELADEEEDEEEPAEIKSDEELEEEVDEDEEPISEELAEEELELEEEPELEREPEKKVEEVEEVEKPKKEKVKKTKKKVPVSKLKKKAKVKGKKVKKKRK